MTPSDIQRVTFEPVAVKEWAAVDLRTSNWPVVYVLDNAESGSVASKEISDVYVGESLNAAARMHQHLSSAGKQHLRSVRVILDDTFNKSVCLDLESFLIRMLAGDGAYRMLNGNAGITESDYYNRSSYQEGFREIFDRLKDDGVFTRSIPEIENSDLFKLSPFKALTQDQAVAVEGILEGLFEDLRSGAPSTTVVQGDPGTGKTVVAIYLLKLLRDIENSTHVDDIDSDSVFSDFFVDGSRDLLTGARVGIVVPQQSLRRSIKKVFKKTPGLREDMVMTAFDVGNSEHQFDLLIVDEAHRLNQRANQPSAAQNKQFHDITVALFGSDDKSKTQLDWIRAKSTHQIFLLDAAQSVRPADLPLEALTELVRGAKLAHRHYPLISQMRVKSGADYIGYVRRMLGASSQPDADHPVVPEAFEGYDFRMFDDLGDMRNAIFARDAEGGLSRMLAGYAWPWASKIDKTAFDIEIDGVQMRWNATQVDWVASPTSLYEVGSIHTVQGYDLNYAGVIIGPDLRFDVAANRIVIDRKSYFDKKGQENNPTLGKTYSDDELQRFIRNIYAVLLTRGIRGTYVYVCDPDLRRHVSTFIRS